MPQVFFEVKDINTTPRELSLKHKVISEPIRLNAEDASIILGMIQSRQSLIGETWIEDVLTNGSAEYRE